MIGQGANDHTARVREGPLALDPDIAQIDGRARTVACVSDFGIGPNDCEAKQVARARGHVGRQPCRLAVSGNDSLFVDLVVGVDLDRFTGDLCAVVLAGTRRERDTRVTKRKELQRGPRAAGGGKAVGIRVSVKLTLGAGRHVHTICRDLGVGGYCDFRGRVVTHMADRTDRYETTTATGRGVNEHVVIQIGKDVQLTAYDLDVVLEDHKAVGVRVVAIAVATKSGFGKGRHRTDGPQTRRHTKCGRPKIKVSM